MRFSKRLLSGILALIMLLCSVSCASISFAQSYPYYSDGYYYRMSKNEELKFNCNYDEMVNHFRTALANRESSVEFYYATTDEAYKYIYNDEKQEGFKEARQKLFNQLLKDVFSYASTDPLLGDYLYKSIYGYTTSLNTYITNLDVTSDGTQYYTFYISMSDIMYYTNNEQEQYVAKFLEEFKKEYISPDDSDYDKVKAIYDFVVRNTEYDNEVYEGKYAPSSSRYKFSHSAYGAIAGNILDEKSTDVDFDWTTKDSVQGQKIEETFNQGLAVCEGYATLFYALCVDNDIPCRIVDGDYQDGKSDPHEWNYVYLNDESGDGYKWFQIDTTFASRFSYKEIDYNSYEYFLVGSDNSRMKSHQQPYQYTGNVALDDDVKIIQQLYDWYSDEYKASVEDYKFPAVKLGNTLNENTKIVISRTYDFEGIERTSFILTDPEGSFKIERDEDGILHYNEVEGFTYNGIDSVYKVTVPYVVNGNFTTDDVPNDVGTHTVNYYGMNNDITVKITIAKMNMDGSEDNENNNYSEINVENNAYYTGTDITPRAIIYDGFNNKLVEGVDYDIVAYTDSEHKGKPTPIHDIGTYYVSVEYKGNYSGRYNLTFTVNPIKLSLLENKEFSYSYVPKNMRQRNNLNNVKDYFLKGVDNLSIGDINIEYGTDYDVTYSGNMEYGDSGTITLIGLEGSSKVIANDSKTYNYTVDQKFDISSIEKLDGSYATSKVYTYTGKAIIPSELENLNTVLDESEYTVEYADNVNVGNAKVIVSGKGGCTGTVTMYFVIAPISISKCTITPKYTNTSFSYTITYGGKSLTKGKDYKETFTSTSAGTTITITGIGNYNGNYIMKINGMYAPTSSGNTVSLSYNSATYTGKALKPSVTVKNKNGKTVHPYFYTSTYSANTNVGSAKIVVKFKTGASGITKYFSINPKGTSLSGVSAGKKGSITIKWYKQATQTTGYQIQYSTDKKFKKNTKTVTIGKNKTTSNTVKKLTAKKKYYVRVRTYRTIGKTNYYSSWSGYKTVTTKK